MLVHRTPSTVRRMLPTFPARIEESCDELASHAQAGPRYTSYPPATQFRDRFGVADARTELAALPDEPVALYCHVPFCSQLCWYCACNVTATRDRSHGSEYVELLVRELDDCFIALVIFQTPPAA